MRGVRTYEGELLFKVESHCVYGGGGGGGLKLYRQ